MQNPHTTLKANMRSHPEGDSRHTKCSIVYKKSLSSQNRSVKLPQNNGLWFISLNAFCCWQFRLKVKTRKVLDSDCAASFHHCQDERCSLRKLLVILLRKLRTWCCVLTNEVAIGNCHRLAPSGWSWSVGFRPRLLGFGVFAAF